MIETLLIANRGEIAMRVLRTCKEMGIHTVAVYSDADAGTPVVREADVAIRLGPPPPAESYLDMHHILAIAKGNGVDAIHPGYGFLAENPEFSAACVDNGIAFVGPSPEVIRAMGDKAEAKHRMMAAGVPVVPGYSGDLQDAAALTREAAEVGFPLLLKAVAGGGGRGIRLVEEPAGLEAALESARREAQGAFGDDRIMIEKYLRRTRHVEIQIMADSQGSAIHLCERECSVQRRHQKVIEETPSPALTAELRQAMGAAGVAAAKAVGYLGAGTVEFLLDEDGSFYFLEMNTRIQVEHPITEMTLGLDLVRMQIEIADGRPLALTQDAISPRGHAIECRINAENPAKRFLPSVGRIGVMQFPPVEGLRVDTGFEGGSEISPFYDSMVAKVVVWGGSREEALRRMRRTLAQTRITGILTNIPFLQAVLNNGEFTSGDYATTLVEQNLEELTQTGLSPLERQEILLAAAALEAHRALAHRLANSSNGSQVAVRLGQGQGPEISAAVPFSSPWSRHADWHTEMGPENPMRRTYLGAGDEAAAEIILLSAPRESRDGAAPSLSLRVAIDGLDHEIGLIPLGADRATLDLGEVRLPLRWSAEGDIRWITLRGRHFRLTVASPESATKAMGSATGGDRLVAPLPGKVIKVAVDTGQRVKRGDLLMIIEAMKMEHQIAAPFAGEVTHLHFKEGDPVNKDDLLLDLNPQS